MKFPISPRFVSDKVSVALVGCGGNGSQMLTGLARMHIALQSLGHPGLKVTTFDPDRVSEANVGRQLFSPSDVGHHKATLLTHRLNIFFGLDWEAEPIAFPGEQKGYHTRHHIVVGCVDSAKSRRSIYAYGERFVWEPEHRGQHLWLDVGNLNNTGQVILGEFTPSFGNTKACNRNRVMTARMGVKGDKATLKEWRESVLPIHLPNVCDLFPEILDAGVPEVDIPSCSLAQALESQDLFINQTVTTFALQLLWMLFRQGGLDHHGYFVNLASGSVSKLAIDKEVWARFNPAIVGRTPPKSLDSKAKASRVKRNRKPSTHARKH